MIRSGAVIAESFRRVSTDEDRAGVTDLGNQRARHIDCQFQMLGRDVIRHGAGLVEITHQNQRAATADRRAHDRRSEEHTSELQSLMRTSSALFCLKKKNNNTKSTSYILNQIRTNNTKN